MYCSTKELYPITKIHKKIQTNVKKETFFSNILNDGIE